VHWHLLWLMCSFFVFDVTKVSFALDFAM